MIRSIYRLTSIIANVVAASAVFFLFVSCNQTDSHGTEELLSKNILRYDVNEPFASLNPLDYQSGSGSIFPFLYSYLVIPNSKGELEADLAKSWIYDSKTYTWTVSIRKDARFHNGETVTADDVVHSIKTELSNWDPTLFAAIREIVATADDRIVIKLKENQPDYLAKISGLEIVPLSNSSGSCYYPSIGSGPFRFVSRNGSTEVMLAANKDYYGGHPELDGVVFYYQPHKEKTWARLLSGQTDVASEIAPDDYNIIKNKRERYYFDVSCINYCTVLLFNVRDPLFSDLKTRQALACAVDRERIINEALSGCGRIPVDLIPDERPDPARALALLKEAGWNLSGDGRLRRNGRPFEFTIFVFDQQQVEKRVAAYLQLCFSELGIRTRIKALPYESFFAHYNNRNFQTVIIEYRLGPPFFHLDSNRRKRIGEVDPDILRMMAFDSGMIRDPEGKGVSLGPKYDFVIPKQPAVFLFRKITANVMSRRFKLRYPFRLTHEGKHRLRHASLDRSISGKSSP